VIEAPGGKVINESTNVIMQLILCNGFIDDSLEMGGPISWPKWKY
jgi:hypothetical protein